MTALAQTGWQARTLIPQFPSDIARNRQRTHAVPAGSRVALCKVTPGDRYAGWQEQIGADVTCRTCQWALALRAKIESETVDFTQTSGESNGQTAPAAVDA